MNIKDYDSMLRSLEERPPLPLYQEILKLDRMLAENDIPHEISRLFDGWVIRCMGGTVIEHLSSYGGGKDLVEIWGFGLRQPQGWLTAEQAFERIKGARQ